jgi:hypothetical protein
MSTKQPKSIADQIIIALNDRNLIFVPDENDVKRLTKIINKVRKLEKELENTKVDLAEANDTIIQLIGKLLPLTDPDTFANRGKD